MDLFNVPNLSVLEGCGPVLRLGSDVVKPQMRSRTVARSDTLCRPQCRQTRLQYQHHTSCIGSGGHSTHSQQRRRCTRFRVVTHWLLQRRARRVSESHHRQAATGAKPRRPLRHRNMEIRPRTDATNFTGSACRSGSSSSSVSWCSVACVTQFRGTCQTSARRSRGPPNVI